MINHISKRSQQIFEYGILGFMLFVFGFPVAVASFLFMTFIRIVSNKE